MAIMMPREEGDGDHHHNRLLLAAFVVAPRILGSQP